MSSAELLPNKKGQIRAYVIRNSLGSLLSFLAVDLVVGLCFEGKIWTWIVLAVVEAILLALIAWRSGCAVRQALEPLQTLAAAAESLKDASLNAVQLRQLSQKLERVDAQTLKRKVAVAGSEEWDTLGETINDMLARIDQRYQAQVRFTSDASHELRTPIAVIKGYADLLDRWGKDDPQVLQEGIDAIRQEADNMGAMVEQLLFLVRGDNETQKVSMTDTDLTALVTAVVRETDLVDDAHQIGSDVQENVTAVCDPAMIKECLRVLCDNALKYTPDGGSVSVRLRSEDGYAHISVIDTGVGISEEDLPRVFDRFFRADQSRSRATGGTGLGLSIAAWIAARHAGWIDVTSQPGEGSQFVLVLPLVQPEPEEEKN